MTQKSKITNTNAPMIRKVSHLAAIEKQYKALKEEIDIMKAELLEIMQKDDVLTLKTGEYTISRAKRVTPQIESVEILKNSLEEAKIPYDMVEAFAPHMNETFKQAIKQGKQLNGLGSKETEYVVVRVTK